MTAAIMFYIKRGDNSPSMAFQLVDPPGENGKPVIPNITGGTVKFHYVETEDFVTAKSGASIVTKDVTITDAATAKVRVDWTSAEVAVVKKYIGELESVVSGVRKTYFNSPGSWIGVQVVSDLADQ